MTDRSYPEAVFFIDGQNLFYGAKESFGYSYPNYDPIALAGKICLINKWSLKCVRFYTGVPDIQDKPFWHNFWSRKLDAMGKRGVVTFRRPLKYRNKTIELADGTSTTTLIGQEKGVDIRIALDMVRMAHRKEYEVAVVLSQDQDLTEAVEEVKAIAKEQSRRIRIACGFPTSPTFKNQRGIDKTDWIKITRAVYDACLDPTDYRSVS